MNALLIHNDNLPTPLINGFDHHLKFDIGQAKILEFDFSFDQEAHNQLNKVLENQIFDVVFIPYNLSVNNYLELSGLRLALHIRLTEKWNHRFIPIVFIGHETKEQIAKLTDYGSFLFSSGIFSTTKFDYGPLMEQFNWIEKSWKPGNKSLLSNSEYDLFLSRIKIEPSASHKSHHSIVNEWAMYRWAKALGNISEGNAELRLIDKIISTSLYFKYLIAVNKIAPLDIEVVSELKLSNTGKVLLIDDEANKGWYEIFCSLLYDNNPDTIEFHYVDDDLFRHKSQEEIIALSIEKIKEVKGLPDVIILDLRIHPLDIEAESIQEMTGFKLVEKIKEINPGIQVLIFSATNKVWNLQALQKSGADGFILKESPENSNDSSFTKKSIEKMLQTLNYSLEFTFLKDFYNKHEELKTELVPRKNYKKSPKPLPKEFVDEVLKWLEMSYNILGSGLSDINKASAFIMLFSVLENLSNRVIDVENPKRIDYPNSKSHFEFEFRNEKKKLRFYNQKESGQYFDTGQTLELEKSLIPWSQKIMNTIHDLNAGTGNNEDLNSLIKKRNDIIHANSTTGDQADIQLESIIFLNSLIYKGLINIS